MQNHEHWMQFAQEDLKAAQGLLPLELFSAVAYHSQQAAEKALKAYLVYKNQPIVRTHDLLQLIELCMRFENDFENIFDAADCLNPFSTKFRYPSEYDVPDYDDAAHAIFSAESILNFVVKKIHSIKNSI